jgi:hypothetical protein
MLRHRAARGMGIRHALQTNTPAGHVRNIRRSLSRDAGGFLDKHALDEIGVDEDFAASLRDKGAGRSVSL